jgi:6-pyruvoyl-tetrahydropterin synthase
MEQSLVARIAPRLRELGKGGYAREYRRGGRRYRSSLHAAVAGILDALGVSYREGVELPGGGGRADFEVNGTFVFVDEAPEGAGEWRRRSVLITRSGERSDRFDSGIRVVGMGGRDGGRRQTIFLDDPSFNFDYAHILPHTQKCSVMHGHTSSALVEIAGRPVDGMVVDFGEAKERIRDAIRELDHKLFINRKYVMDERDGSVTLSFRTVHGEFRITAPKATTVLLEGEATVENMARELLSRIAPGMPENVEAVGVYVYEGLNKGTHLLAQVHRDSVGRGRKGR